MAAGDVVVNISSPQARKGAIFDGIDDEIQITQKTYDLNTIGTTFCFWMKRTKISVGAQQVVFGQDSDAFKRWLEINAANYLRLETDTNSDYAGNVSCDNLLWEHFVFAIKSLNVTAYRNGVYDEITNPTITDSGITMNRLGSGGNTYYLGGCLSDFRIYEGKLTASQVSKVYAGETLKDATLLNRWKLENDYNDSTGNNNGTNNGSRLGIIDTAIDANVTAARVTANDKYLIAPSGFGRQVITTVIEEAP